RVQGRRGPHPQRDPGEREGVAQQLRAAAERTVGVDLHGGGLPTGTLRKGGPPDGGRRPRWVFPRPPRPIRPVGTVPHNSQRTAKTPRSGPAFLLCPRRRT